MKKYYFLVVVCLILFPVSIKASNNDIVLIGENMMQAGKTSELILSYQGQKGIQEIEYTIDPDDNLELLNITSLNKIGFTKTDQMIVQKINNQECSNNTLNLASINVKAPTKVNYKTKMTLNIKNIKVLYCGETETEKISDIEKTFSLIQTTSLAASTSKSADASLSSLEIENINFEFSKEKNYYEIKVPNDIENLVINAIPTNEKATVKVMGNTNLLVGQNFVTVEITIEDKASQTYTIKVVREATQCQEKVCQTSKVCDDKSKGWMIISGLLVVAVISLLGYVIWDKKN